MIPARKHRDHQTQDHVRHGTVSAKLARLRAEHRRSDRRLRGERPTFNDDSGYERQSHALTVLMNSLTLPQTRQTSGQSSVAGPAAPKSWTTEPLANDTRATTKITVQGVTVTVPKNQLVKPLRAASRSVCTVPSLLEAAGQVVAFDLKKSSNKSILLPYVHLLPAHIKLKLFDFAAMSWPLEYRVMEELLRHEDASSKEFDTDVGEWDSEGSRSEEAANFDRHLPSLTVVETPMSILLTTLNLAFSSITTSQLRSLLTTDSSSTTNPRPIARFPHLSTLSLCATTNISFHDSLFKTLSAVISLRKLSLAATNVSLSTVPITQVLNRLASSTPTLVELDLSFTLFCSGSRDNDVNLIWALDWSTRWLELDVLGLRSVECKSTQTASDVRRVVLEGRARSIATRKRQWIDVVT
ncbi:hypothetical protein ACM66B_003595 [Microbotryomycetes sp. NB124-2]